MRSPGWLLAVCAAALVAIACGGDGEVASTETASAASASAEAEADAPAAEPSPAAVPGAPVVHRVRLIPDEVRPGEAVEAIVEARRADGSRDDSLDLVFAWQVGERMLAGGDARMTLPANARKGAPITVEVRASDGVRVGSPLRGTGVVGNQPPEWRQLELTHRGEIERGTHIGIQPVAVDRDLDGLEYRVEWWLNDRFERAGEIAEAFDTAALDRGDTLFARVWVSDGDDQLDARDTPSVEIANSEPEIVSAPGQFGNDGRFVYEIEVQDADGDRRMRYSLVEGPEGMDLDRVTGELTWTPTLEQQGAHAIEFSVKDAYGGEDRQRFELTVRDSPPETTPAAPAP